MGTVKRLFNALGTQISDKFSHQNEASDEYYIALYDYEEQKEQIYELIKNSIACKDPEVARNVIVKYRQVAESDPIFTNLVNQWNGIFNSLQSSTYAVTQAPETAPANSVTSNTQQVFPGNPFRIIALKEQFEQKKGRILNALFDSFKTNNLNVTAGLIEKYYPVAQKDADFFDVIKHIEQELKSKNLKQLEATLNTIPESDAASRMPIVHRILKIDPNADNYKSELIRCEKLMGENDTGSYLDGQMDLDGVSINQLPSTMQFKKNALIEIKDERVLSLIKDLVPKIVKSNPSAPKLTNTLGKGQYQLYLVKSKNALAEVKGNSGVFRGFSKDAQGRINGHAELLPIDPGTIAANAGSLAVVNSAMIAMTVGMVAIVVVGAYFMNRINHQISNLQYELSQISDFLDSEYQGKISALCAQIARTSRFTEQLMMNDELRSEELKNLDRNEHECIELVGQANINLDKIINRPFTNYEKYEADIKQIEKWQQYQTKLMFILYGISQLKYVFHQGKLPPDYYMSLYNTYKAQAQAINDKLLAYHTKAVDHFEIDIDLARRKENGILYKPLSMLNSDYSYQSISTQTIALISKQVSAAALPEFPCDSTDDLFNDDVRIILNEGHTYYYPKEYKKPESYNYPALVSIIRNSANA